MIKRVTWFISGAVAGIAGAGYAKRKVKATAEQLAPVNVAKNIGARAKARGHDVADAIREGRQAMRAKEAELRARRDGRAEPLADELDRGDEVLVHGLPVEPGQVIVLRQVREGSTPRRRH